MLSQDKLSFLDETCPTVGTTRKSYEVAFRAMEPLEAEWGTDFTLQPREVLEQAFNESVCSSRYVNAYKTLTLLQKYAKWRVANGLPCGDGIHGVTIDTSYRMRKTMVSSPLHLLRVLNLAFDPPGQSSPDVLYRAFLWMGFAGLDAGQAVRVVEEQLDLYALTITYEGEVFRLPSESVPDFREIASLTGFLEHSARANGTVYTRSFERVPGNRLMRGRPSQRVLSLDESVTKSIRPFITTKLRQAAARSAADPSLLQTGLETSFNYVHLSGQFCRLYELERLGEAPNFRALAQADFDKRKHSDKPYSDWNSTYASNTVTRLALFMRNDYNSWKKAFMA